MYCKELQSKKDNVLIVRGSVLVISSSQQCVWFAHSMSGAVVKQEIKSSQMQGPTHLTTVKFLGYYEILEVLVVGPDFHQMGPSFQKVPPLL